VNHETHERTRKTRKGRKLSCLSPMFVLFVFPMAADAGQVRGGVGAAERGGAGAGLSGGVVNHETHERTRKTRKGFRVLRLPSRPSCFQWPLTQAKSAAELERLSGAVLARAFRGEL
jgi:hypothetical protein